jgi:hypothetical protein
MLRGLSERVGKHIEKQKSAAEKERRVQEALKALKDEQIKTVSEAAHHFEVSHHTLRRRQLGRNGPPSKSQVKKQLLTEAQEETLVEWIKHMGVIGEPFSKWAIHAKVADLSELLQEKTKKTGKIHLPLRNWVYEFLCCHPNLLLKRPTGLDNVHMHNFNLHVVGRHFWQLDELLKANDVPLENLYNMDEKGIQLGSGRQLDGTRYLYSKDQPICVKTQNVSLELVTTIECVAADGSDIKPGFVFSGKNILHRGYFEEDGVL